MGSVQSPTEPLFLVIGAGSRGNAYARAVNKSTPGRIAAVAEPDSFKRADFGRKYIWEDSPPQPGQSFSGWEEYLAWETDQTNVDSKIKIAGIFICTMDETHAEIIQALAPLKRHIFCEKPLAQTLTDCLSISRALAAHPPRIFSIGHVLRYSPHNILLRKLVCEDQAIGEIVSIEHTEPVGYWHFAHSYVRGNWRRTHDGVGSLLTKSCHDIDFVMWLLCSPSPLTGDTPHLPSTIYSSGSLTHFRRASKPAQAGSATNCISCPIERSCIYSAPRIYRDKFLRGNKDTGWPVKIVVPEIEDIVLTQGWDAGEQALMSALSKDYGPQTPDHMIKNKQWYGRCVYESDNDVVSDQSVTITWAAESSIHGRGPKQALIHMTYPTQSQCERRGRIYGTHGEISYDSSSITVFDFASQKETTHQIPPLRDPEAQKAHGGGDWGLAGQFVAAVQAVDDAEGITTGVAANGDTSENKVRTAQWKHVGCDTDEVVRSHMLVFAAEESRRTQKVVGWEEWAGRNWK